MLWHCSWCGRENNSEPVGRERDNKVVVCAHCGKRSYIPPPVSPRAFRKYQELRAAGLEEKLMTD